jgi:hypothetical protein
MADEPEPQRLNDRGPQPERAKYKDDAEAWRWRLRRFWFRVSLFVLIGPPVVYFGANYQVFGRFTVKSSDFIPIVQKDGIPAVRAIMEYQRDNGPLPPTLDYLCPKYLSEEMIHTEPFKGIENSQFRLWVEGKYTITYDLDSAGGWRLDGPFGSVPIPLPPVTIGPATRSTPPAN